MNGLCEFVLCDFKSYNHYSSKLLQVMVKKKSKNININNINIKVIYYTVVQRRVDRNGQQRTGCGCNHLQFWDMCLW